MDLLGLTNAEGTVNCTSRLDSFISYVIINPTSDMQLELGDVV